MKFQRPAKKLEEAIDRGATDKSDKEQAKKEKASIVIRIRKDLLPQIEEAVEKRIGISRTAWILEAIQEKLKKELTND